MVRKNSASAGLWMLEKLNSAHGAINETENGNVTICITMLLSCHNKNEVLFA